MLGVHPGLQERLRDSEVQTRHEENAMKCGTKLHIGKQSKDVTPDRRGSWPYWPQVRRCLEQADAPSTPKPC